jgi:hypothetical protein
VIVNQIGHLAHLEQFISAIENHLHEKCAVGHLYKSLTEKKISEADKRFKHELYAVDFALQERIFASDNKILKTV